MALARKVQRASGKPPRYPGTCRHLSAQEVERKLAEGEKPTLRFRVAEDAVIEFTDTVKGPQRFYGRDIGDFIIRRANGTSPFMFCNAVDDGLMGVTVVLRGEDHLTNTPRQLMIFQALGLSAPTYGHIALIVGDDGSPLSKRHGSQSVQALREAGYLPTALINYLARLGHHYAEDALMSLTTLAEKFLTASLGRAPARFDAQQMLHWQKEAMACISVEALWQLMPEEVQQQVPEAAQSTFIALIRPNITFPQEAKKWSDIFYAGQVVYDTEGEAIIEAAGAEFFSVALRVLDQAGADFKKMVTTLKTELGVKGKKLFQPLRVALTGELHGPELAEIIALLGADQARVRLEQAAALANK